MALALRVEAPIFVADEVVEEAGLVPEETAEGDDEGEGEDVVEQFREFIDSVNPDDFAS